MQRHFDLDGILNMERRPRATLMNYLSGFKSVNLIGTQNNEEINNLAVFNSVIHIGSNPPFLGFILRPTTVERHTYENIQATQFYTINAVTQAIYTKSHQTSAKYAADQSEFAEVDLTPEFKDDFHAPYVAESPIQFGLQLEEVQHNKCNDTLLVIGKVQHLYLPENSYTKEGHFDLSEYEVVTIGGLYTYYKTEKIERLKYAQPK
ncbi:MAG: flavin reductase [Bacteroidota bacterium]